MNKCKSCQADIIWCKSARGNKMPIERNDKGNLIVVGGIAHVIPKGQEPTEGMQRFISHHATCPHAAAHRKAKAVVRS